MSSPPPRRQDRRQLQPSPEPPSAADAQSLRVFEEEVRSAVSYEKGLAVKALLALAVVALVVTIRVLFLG